MINLLGMILSIGGLALVDDNVPTIKIQSGTAEFLSGTDLIARYEFQAPDHALAKPFLWPLNAPGGIPVTRAWPMEPAVAGGSTDHVHQKSLWFCHGDVIPEGMTGLPKIKGVAGIDFWSEGKGHGEIVCLAAQAVNNRLVSRNEWRTLDGRKVLDEARTIQIIDFKDARLLIFECDLLASEFPITFGDTKEGSFGVRVNDAIREGKGGRIENADGLVGEIECWGRRSTWCDYSGTVAGKKAGIAIFDDPHNRYPAAWHVRAYGLMAANPFGRAHAGFPATRGQTDLARIPKGEHLRLRYGVLVHTGDVSEGHVKEYYERFVLKEPGK